jgi:hypothetical protein
VNDELGIVIAVVAGVGCVIGCVFLWFMHTRGSSALRAKRARALLQGSLAPGVPFEIAGTMTRGGPVTVHLDLNVHVLGGADVEVSFRSAGVRLSFELETNGVRTASGETKLPADRTKIGPDVRAVDTIYPSQRTRINCTVPVEAVTVAPGQYVRVRGVMTPLPDNEVHEATLWLG